MKDEILDEIEETIEIGGPPVYASKSFNQFLISIFFYLILIFVEFQNSGEYSKEALVLGILITIVLFWLNLSGMINASKSERFQEKVSWKKYVGTIGNLFLFLPSFGLLILLIFEVFALVIYNF